MFWESKERAGAIRTSALAILRRADSLLLGRGHDHVSGKPFLMPPGGPLTFGEYAHKGVERQTQEQTGHEIETAEYFATLESMFVLSGRRCHEIALLFAARFAHAEAYRAEEILLRRDGDDIKALWIPLEQVLDDPRAIYPHGLAETLEQHWPRIPDGQ